MVKKYATPTKTIVTKVGNYICKELEEAKRLSISYEKAQNNGFIASMLNISVKQVAEIRQFFETDIFNPTADDQKLITKYFSLPEV